MRLEACHEETESERLVYVGILHPVVVVVDTTVTLHLAISQQRELPFRASDESISHPQIGANPQRFILNGPIRTSKMV